LKLILIPDNYSKHDIIHFRFLTDSILLSKKSKVSSAFCILIIPDEQKDLNIPETRLLFAALISMRVKTSATKIKQDRGNRIPQSYTPASFKKFTISIINPYPH
jgi:hypothetical protein